MADDIYGDLTKGVLAEPAQAEKPAPEIDWHDRLILNNIFDTQPAKRAAYLKQKGFEIDPKDDNLFRPIGSKGEYLGKIDPSYHEAYKKGGLTGVLKEGLQDVGDVGYDVGISALSRLGSIGEGAAAGAEAGAIAAPVTGGASVGIGAVIGGIGMGVASGALSNAAAEALKQNVGDLYLNEKIPTDMKATAVQSLFAGVVPQLFKGGGKSLSWAVQKAKIGSVVKGIENAAAAHSGNELTPTILKEAAQNPDMFSPQNVKKVGAKLNEGYSKLFGLDPESPQMYKNIDGVKSGSVFGEALAPLNEQANKELSTLSKNPEDSISLREALQPFASAKDLVERRGGGSAGDIAGLKAADMYQNQFEKLAEKTLRSQGVQGEISHAQLLDTPLDFSKVYNISKTMKDAAYDENVHGADMLAKIAGSGDDQLSGLLNKKATNAGSDWASIQSQRSQIFDVAKRTEPLLRPAKMASAFLGGDSSPSKAATIAAAEELDDHFGTELSSKLKNLNAQKSFSDFYRNPDIYSSSNPYLQKAKDVLSTTKKSGLFAGGAELLSAGQTKLRPGENLAEVYGKRIADLNGGIDQRFMQSMARPSVNVAGQNVSMPVGLTASKLYQPQPEQTPVSQQSQRMPDENDDIYNALLQGVK